MYVYIKAQKNEMLAQSWKCIMMKSPFPKSCITTPSNQAASSNSSCFESSFVHQNVQRISKHIFPNGSGKRKSSESSFHPVRKQLITDARIALSMERLSLYTVEVCQTDNSSPKNVDEGFWEDIMSCDTSSDDNNIIPSSTPINKIDSTLFFLSTDVKKGLDQMKNDILPANVFKSINESYLAVVPYRPLDHISKHVSYIKTDSIKEDSKNVACSNGNEQYKCKEEKLECDYVEDIDMT